MVKRVQPKQWASRSEQSADGNPKGSVDGHEERWYLMKYARWKVRRRRVNLRLATGQELVFRRS
jgi:hypothetical protein